MTIPEKLAQDIFNNEQLLVSTLSPEEINLEALEEIKLLVSLATKYNLTEKVNKHLENLRRKEVYPKWEFPQKSGLIYQEKKNY